MRLVTIGRNRINGDRSYVGEIWQVIGVTVSVVAVWQISGHRWSKEPEYLLKDEYVFEDAYPLLTQEDLRKCLLRARY